MRISFNPEGKILNSFWLWFAAAVMVLQLFLLYMVLFVLMKPASEALGQTIVALYDAIAQIEQVEGEAGTRRYLNTVSKLDRFVVEEGLPAIDEKKMWYPAFKSFENVLAREDGDLKAVYSSIPSPSAYFFKESSPLAVLRVSLTEPPFAERYLILSVVTTLFITLVAAYWISTRLANPIASLAAQATKMADGTDNKQIVVSKKASPEIGELAAALNHMRADLDRSMSEREQFLAMVSHDLRTPLSRMSLWLDVGSASSDEINKYLQSDIDEMRSFLEQFVELTKLNGEIDERWSNGDLTELLRELKDRYSRAGTNITLDVDDALPLKFKPVALSRLLYNLTDNAIRYGAGTVHLSAERKIDGIHLTISNPVTVIRRILGVVDAFNAANQIEEETHGAGLGKKIVKQFASVHGAKIVERADEQSRSVTIIFASEMLS